MDYEVEQKFRVSDFKHVEAALGSLAASIQPAVTQVDHYYEHPSRDFSQTDEALRIRRVGDTQFITYKGPKIDKTTKTRREIELPLAAGEKMPEQFGELLKALGFSSVAELPKQRRMASALWRNREITVSLDEIDSLGKFVELEILTGEEDLEAAKALIFSFAEHLGLADVERRSYLELLLKVND